MQERSPNDFASAPAEQYLFPLPPRTKRLKTAGTTDSARPRYEDKENQPLVHPVRQNKKHVYRLRHGPDERPLLLPVYNNADRLSLRPLPAFPPPSEAPSSPLPPTPEPEDEDYDGMGDQVQAKGKEPEKQLHPWPSPAPAPVTHSTSSWPIPEDCLQIPHLPRSTYHADPIVSTLLLSFACLFPPMFLLLGYGIFDGPCGRLRENHKRLARVVGWFWTLITFVAIVVGAVMV